MTTNGLFGTLYLASNLLRNRFKLTRPNTESSSTDIQFREFSSKLLKSKYQELDSLELGSDDN